MRIRRTLLAAVALTALGALTACGTGDPATEIKPEDKPGRAVNLGPDQQRIRTGTVDAIAAKVPEAVRARGTLVVGVSAGGQPPLSFYATDDKTLIGVETDLATLVADTLGLKPDFQAVSWENLFVGTFSGAGAGLQGKIAATTKKGSGLVGAYAAALDHVIANGGYAKVLERWGLSSEAVEKSEINPPGLPRTAN